MCVRREEEQGGGSVCVCVCVCVCVVGRWGSGKVGGRKLIITIDGSMDVLDSVSLIRSVNSVHAKYGSTQYICQSRCSCSHK